MKENIRVIFVYIVVNYQIENVRMFQILNTNIKYSSHPYCQHHDVPVGHCHWCVMEIVSSVILLCFEKIT